MDVGESAGNKGTIHGEIDADYAIHCLFEAKKKKVNFFDTSPAYGESEKIIEVFAKN